MRPRNGSDPVTFTTNTVIRILGGRIQGLNTEMASIDHMLSRLVAATAPSLLELHGVGVDSAATLLVTAGDNPDRLTSEGSWGHLCGVAPLPASTGKTPRHRLNRGGDRQANAALYRIVPTRMSNHPETRRYVTRRRTKDATPPRSCAA
jgi:transposase